MTPPCARCPTHLEHRRKGGLGARDAKEGEDAAKSGLVVEPGLEKAGVGRAGEAPTERLVDAVVQPATAARRFGLAAVASDVCALEPAEPRAAVP